MPLLVHHLRVSQSERIVWLCEELGVPYTLQCYDRAPIFAPPELKAIPGNELGTAPVLQDGEAVTLCESGAIVEYLLARYGEGSALAVDSHAPHYAQYLYWLHAANGTLQPLLGRNMAFAQAGIPEDNMLRRAFSDRLSKFLGLLDARLADTGAFLAGLEVTAADTMTVFSLTTFRHFYRYSLAEYPHILAYLRRVSERPAYKRAMEKGNPDMELVLGAEPPAKTLFETASR